MSRRSTMQVSGNELAFLIRWAARGGGVPTGLAEDLATGARVLALAGLDPLKLVVPALDALAPNHGWGRIALDEEDRLWDPDGHPLMAVEAGPALADLIAQSRPAKAAAVDHPLLAAAIIAGLGGEGCLLASTGFWVGMTAGRFRALGASDESILFTAAPAALVHARTMENAPDAPFAMDAAALDRLARLVRNRGVTVDGDAWSALKGLAARSWVPASEQSRLRGAGAGLTDND